MADGVFLMYEDDYPLDALPAAMRAAVEDVKAITQAPLALIVASALASAATACQGLADVQRPTIPGAVPLSLNFVTVAESGERKSAADHFFFAPVAQFDRDQRAEFELNLRKFQTDERVWRVKLKGMERNLQKATAMGDPTDDLEELLRAHHDAAPKPPQRLRIALSDITPAALCGELEVNICTAVLHSNEAADLMRGRTMGNLPLLNRCWDGQVIEVDRRDKTKSAFISGARLSISLAVQPDSFEAMSQGRDEHARHSGFLARALLSFPTSTAGKRAVSEWGHASDLSAAIVEFQNRIRTLLEFSFDRHSQGVARQVLTFDDDARRYWVQFFNQVEAELKPDTGAWCSIKDFAAKAAEHAARLAAVFEVFQDPEACKISLKSIQHAVGIVRWHLYAFDRHLGKGASALRVKENASALLQWMQTKAQSQLGGGCRKYTRRELLQFGPRAIRNAASLELAIEMLVNERKLICENTKRGLLVYFPFDLRASIFGTPTNTLWGKENNGFISCLNGLDGSRGLASDDVRSFIEVDHNGKQDFYN